MITTRVRTCTLHYRWVVVNKKGASKKKRKDLSQFLLPRSLLDRVTFFSKSDLCGIEFREGSPTSEDIHDLGEAKRVLVGFA